MASVAHLDTHVVVWLYAGDTARLSKSATRTIESAPLAVSPMVLLELAYLHEIGRTTGPGEEAIDFLRSSIGLVVADDPFDQVATAATKLSFTRDPFDRIITAQASLRRRRLVTADQSIRENYRHSVW